jgi:hypothetical protein
VTTYTSPSNNTLIPHQHTTIPHSTSIRRIAFTKAKKPQYDLTTQLFTTPLFSISLPPPHGPHASRAFPGPQHTGRYELFPHPHCTGVTALSTAGDPATALNGGKQGLLAVVRGGSKFADDDGEGKGMRDRETVRERERGGNLLTLLDQEEALWIAVASSAGREWTRSLLQRINSTFPLRLSSCVVRGWVKRLVCLLMASHLIPSHP